MLSDNQNFRNLIEEKTEKRTCIISSYKEVPGYHTIKLMIMQDKRLFNMPKPIHGTIVLYDEKNNSRIILIIDKTNLEHPVFPALVEISCVPVSNEYLETHFSEIIDDIEFRENVMTQYIIEDLPRNNRELLNINVYV